MVPREAMNSETRKFRSDCLQIGALGQCVSSRVCYSEGEGMCDENSGVVSTEWKSCNVHDVPHFTYQGVKSYSLYPPAFVQDPSGKGYVSIPDPCSQCGGGVFSGEDLCGDKYEGPLCDSCKIGYGKNGMFCIPCPNFTENVSIMVGIGAGSLAVIGVLVRNTMSQGEALRKRYKEGGKKWRHGDMQHAKLRLSILGKIFISYCQLTAFVQGINIEWPGPVRRMFDTQEKLSTPNPQIASLDCMINQGRDERDNDMFYSKWLLFMSIPPVSFVLAIWFWTTVYAFRKVRRLMGRTKKRMKFETVRINITITLLVILFLTHASLTKQIFTLFSCTKLDYLGDGKFDERVALDLSVDCNTEKHRGYQWLAVMFLVLYSIGIPTLGFTILSGSLKPIQYEFVDPSSEHFDSVLHKEKINVTSKFGFLFKGFSERGIHPFWEVGPVMLRKVFLVFIVVFGGIYEPHVQVLLCILMVVSAVVLQMRYQPYEDADLNSLEMWTLLSSFYTLYTGLFFAVPNTPSEWSDPLAYSILVVNFFVSVLFLWKVGSALLEVKQASKFFNKRKKSRSGEEEEDSKEDDEDEDEDSQDNDRITSLMASGGKKFFQIFEGPPKGSDDTTVFKPAPVFKAKSTGPPKIMAGFSRDDADGALTPIQPGTPKVGTVTAGNGEEKAGNDYVASGPPLPISMTPPPLSSKKLELPGLTSKKMSAPPRVFSIDTLTPVVPLHPQRPTLAPLVNAPTLPSLSPIPSSGFGNDQLVFSGPNSVNREEDEGGGVVRSSGHVPRRLVDLEREDEAAEHAVASAPHSPTLFKRSRGHSEAGEASTSPAIAALQLDDYDDDGGGGGD